MIPKIIHYCWFGRNPLPELAQQCIASWRKYLPDYEIQEWNEDNFDVYTTRYTREAYALKKYAFVSDYARFWVLYKYGGLYFDTDVELIKPIDDIIARGPFMGQEGGMQDSIGLRVATGLGMGAYPGHELFRTILMYYESIRFTTWTGAIRENIVSIVNRHIKSMKVVNLNEGIMKCGDVLIYPEEYFCPINFFTNTKNYTKNTRAIHHYAGTWLSRTLWNRIKHRITDIAIFYGLYPLKRYN